MKMTELLPLKMDQIALIHFIADGEMENSADPDQSAPFEQSDLSPILKCPTSWNAYG